MKANVAEYSILKLEWLKHFKARFEPGGDWFENPSQVDAVQRKGDGQPDGLEKNFNKNKTINKLVFLSWMFKFK